MTTMLAAVLSYNPLLVYNTGFQLSAAVFGILLLRKPLKALVEATLLRASKTPGTVSSLLSVSLAAQIATAPIVAAAFKEVSVIGAVTNVVAVPLSGPILTLGLLASVAGNLTPALGRRLRPLGGAVARARWRRRPLGSAACRVLSGVAMGKSSGRARRVVHRGKEIFVTEGSMPPVERPGSRRQEGEQDHLREDAGVTQEGLVEGEEPAQHLQEDAGRPDRAERDDDEGILDKAKDKLKGQ